MRLPRVKPEHHPHRQDDRTIRLGGALYGLASEIDDPDGSAWTALTLMDGTRPPAAIAADLATRHELELDEAQDIVAALLASGHVEEAAPPPCPELTARERERHRRGRDYFRWVDLTPRTHGWEPQLLLKRSAVLVVGLGGTGGHAAWSLAASGVGRLHLVDPDVVELSNLNRQLLYTEADVGRPKAEAAGRLLRRVNSDIEVTCEDKRVTCQEDLAALLDGFDVLVLCADDPPEPYGIVAHDTIALLTGTLAIGHGDHSRVQGEGMTKPTPEAPAKRPKKIVVRKLDKVETTSPALPSQGNSN